jgi:hypothetical protein
MNRIVYCVFALCLLSRVSVAQNGYFDTWFTRVDKTKDEQPHWITPLATTTPRLEEEFRYDQVWQTNREGTTIDIYDGGKGLELIPFDKVEVILSLPPYLAHNDPLVEDGFGDIAFLLKYRLLSANEQHGNYILAAFIGLSLPTGDHKNGARHPVFTPTLAYGKGFGNVDMQGTFGIAMPTADVALVGRSYVWNNTLQYRLWRTLWPEVELNSSFFQGGENGGEWQNFLTPGIVMGRLHLGGRVGITLGAGYQIPTTRFHTSNHNAILSVRFPF